MVGIWGLKGFPCGSAGKESTCNARDLGQSLGWEDPLEKGKATQSSIPGVYLAWRIPWTIQFMGSQSQTQLRDFRFTSPHFIPNPLGEGNGEEGHLQKNKGHAETIKKIFDKSTGAVPVL